MRILSLLPAATEIVYLLGLEKYLVGVSHACDYPPQVKNKPKVTSSLVSNSMSSKEIDKRVKKIGHKGPGVLKKLKPNDNLTVISLEPESVDDILENVRVVGEVEGRKIKDINTTSD